MDPRKTTIAILATLCASLAVADDFKTIDLSKRGWSLGWVSAIDRDGRTIWIADAHRGDGKRFVVRADEILTAFVELERITHESAASVLLGDDNPLKCW